MAGIQASINQGMSIAAFLFSQTGFAKTQQAKLALEKQASAYDKRMSLLEDYASKTADTRKSKEYYENVAKLKQEKGDIYEELYKLDPKQDYYNIKQGLFREAEQARAEGAKDTTKSFQAEGYFTPEEIEYWEQYNEAVAAAANEPEEQVGGMDFENMESNSADIARQKADESLAVAQQAKTETNNRKKGFTSQRYGTNKTKITFGGNR